MASREAPDKPGWEPLAPLHPQDSTDRVGQLTKPTHSLAWADNSKEGRQKNQQNFFIELNLLYFLKKSVITLLPHRGQVQGH